MHSRPGNRILIMEEDGLLVQLYGDALRHSGYEIHEASNLSIVQEFMKLDSTIDLFICSIRPGYEYRIEFLQHMQPTFYSRGTQVIVINNLGYPVKEKMDNAIVVSHFSSIRELMKLVRHSLNHEQTTLIYTETHV